MTLATKRRKRHRAKAKLRDNRAVRRHARIAGRTGSIKHKQRRARRTTEE